MTAKRVIQTRLMSFRKEWNFFYNFQILFLLITGNFTAKEECSQSSTKGPWAEAHKFLLDHLTKKLTSGILEMQALF